MAGSNFGSSGSFIVIWIPHILLGTFFSLKIFVLYKKEMLRRLLGPKKYAIKIAQGKLAHFWGFITCNLYRKGHEMSTTCMYR
jgi:hypothetical protein